MLSFPPGTKMFQFPGYGSAYPILFRYGYCDMTRSGLPHSDIHGSKPARGSPWLFAACHVLHRLLVPRHPPNALLIRFFVHASENPICVGRLTAIFCAPVLTHIKCAPGFPSRKRDGARAPVLKNHRQPTQHSGFSDACNTMHRSKPGSVVSCQFPVARGT